MRTDIHTLENRLHCLSINDPQLTQTSNATHKNPSNSFSLINAHKNLTKKPISMTETA